jgi:uncharacterized lipoprotein YmbA
MFRWSWLPVLLLVTACASGPRPRVYVLGGPENPVPGTTSDAGRPVVALRRVSLPDYLDTTDILLRDGRNEVKASPTGRWGERLSVGLTRALAETLAKRLPAVVIDQDQSGKDPARTLLISIDAVDIDANSRCVLIGHWTILGEYRRNLAAGEHATIVTSAHYPEVGDSAVVEAIADAIDQLADRIAADLSRTLRNIKFPSIRTGQ